MGAFAQQEDLAVLDDREAFSMEAVRARNGEVFIKYASMKPMYLELQLLTKRGEIIWSEVIHDFTGKATEKVEYELPKGSYIIRAYHGYSETIRRIDL